MSHLTPSLSGTKRKSRFESDVTPSSLGDHSAEIAAKAAEVSRALAARIAASTNLLSKTAPAAVAPGFLQAIQSQIQQQVSDRKAQYRPLLLDAQGREIDEHGNLVKVEIQPVRTLAANIGAGIPQKKKENPYLAHRYASASTNATPTAASAMPTAAVRALSVPGLPASALPPVGTVLAPFLSAAEAEAQAEKESAIVDERIPQKRRDLRGKRALHFVEAGRYVREAEILQEKEERKIVSGFASGRKTIGREKDGEEEKESAATEMKEAEKQKEISPVPDSVVPTMEWWDELFLPKQKREQRKISKAAQDVDEYHLCNIAYIKSHVYVQHPVPVKPLGYVAESAAPVVPVYLTKKERKKLRKATRAEREREKRDKLMLGLIPTPEPKFKLSNFMKILGDQAVADPSKVEQRVLQQMQQRVLNHQMRNLANKLTPQEKRAKKLKKLKEDVSKGVTVCAMRVTDFSSLKHRFKCDVNAQQYFLSGIVLLCGEKGKNLVVAEGGPRGIRRFIHLMTKRIAWDVDVPNNEDIKMVQHGDEWNYTTGSSAANGETENEATREGDDDDDDDDEDEDEEEKINGHSFGGQVSGESTAHRRCDLLWQGLLPKRMFTGFKFQEAQTASAARRLLEGKNAAHYWDMVEQADTLCSSNHNDDWASLF